jgi:hypothetical protein
LSFNTKPTERSTYLSPILAIRHFTSRKSAASGRLGSTFITEAVGVELPDGILWFWIGSQADHDILVG